MIMSRTPWDITREMFLSENEAESLLAHVRARCAHAVDRERAVARLDQLIVECLMYSGIRNSECCRLKLGDTILGTGQSTLIAGGPKRDERRTVHVPQHLSRLIAQYARETRPFFLPQGVQRMDLSEPLFFNEHRNPFERTGLYRRVVRILTEAGLGDRASVQLLRHTYGYLAYLRTGGNLLFVQTQLGHAHPMITSVYAQFVDLSPAHLAETVAGNSSRTPPRTRSRTLHKKKRGVIS
jgi:integrase/recombinase XerD